MLHIDAEWHVPIPRAGGHGRYYMACRVSILVNAPPYVMRRVKLQTNNAQMKRSVEIIKHIAFSHIHHLLFEINFHGIQ